MNKKVKALLLVLCALILVVGSVMGTLAYLTDTKEVQNVFTVGNIAIKLDEADLSTVDADDRTESGNTYHLLPNQTYIKDPTVWVKEGSEEAYIRMIVTVSNYDKMLLAFQSDANYDDDYISNNKVDLTKIADISADWTLNTFAYDADAKTGTYEYRYNAAYTATANDGDANDDYDKLAPLFNKIEVPAQIDNEHLAYLNNTTITVTAQAIQTAGFAADGNKTAVDVAWEAFPAN